MILSAASISVVLSLLSTILGLIIIFIAVSTPAWQVAYVREMQQWLQTGLWMSCLTRPSGMHVCSYASLNPADETNIPISDDMINIRAPTFYTWQTTLLYIFLTAQLCAMLALLSYLFSRSAHLKKAVHIIFSGLVALAALISIGCCIAFMILSHMVEYRFHHVSVSGIYEKRQGYSFYLGLTGSLLYLLALFLSIPSTLSVIRDQSEFGGPSETSQYPAPGMRYTQEDDFAMRGLPNVPRKGR